MENKTIETPTIFDLNIIVAELEKVTKQKAHKETKLGVEYVMGNVTEQQLLEANFKLVGYANKKEHMTPIYRFGNIEALYIDQLLHIYAI